MDSKQVKDLMEAYASVYSSLNEEEMEDAEKEGKEKEGKESGKDEGGKHKEGKHKKGKEEPGEKKTEKEDVEEGLNPIAVNKEPKKGGPSTLGQLVGDKLAGGAKGKPPVKIIKDGAMSVKKEEVEHIDEITRSMGRRATQYRKDQAQAAHMERVRQHQHNMENDPEYRERHERLRQTHSRREDQKESFDLFDVILEYLVAEGYADTNKAALAIMANMSEEWKQSITEGLLSGLSKVVPTVAKAVQNAPKAIDNTLRYYEKNPTQALPFLAPAIASAGMNAKKKDKK